MNLFAKKCAQKHVYLLWYLLVFNFVLDIRELGEMIEKAKADMI